MATTNEKHEQDPWAVGTGHFSAAGSNARGNSK